MKTAQIAKVLKISTRHARRLLAAGDPRVAELIRADIPEEVWAELARDIQAEFPTKMRNENKTHPPGAANSDPRGPAR